MEQVLDSDYSTSEPSQRYVRLFFDGLNLLLPQHQLHTLEPVSDLQTTAGCEDGVGWITNGGYRWPVYCLSSALDMMNRCPHGRHICALVAHQSQAFGLVCEDVDTMPGQDLVSWSLPTCMYTPGTPINALALHDGRVYCITTVTDMGGYMERRGCVTVAHPGMGHPQPVNL